MRALWEVLVSIVLVFVAIGAFASTCILMAKYVIPFLWGVL
jgi:hypothetical protein